MDPYVDSTYGSSQEFEGILDRLAEETRSSFSETTTIEDCPLDLAPGNGRGAVVFAATTDAIPTAIDRPTLWVARDPSTAAAAIDAGALDALTWDPSDGTDLLVRKLSQFVADSDDRRTTTSGESPGLDDDRSDRTAYESLVKTIGDGVYLLDTDGRFTFVNDALCEMTGYDREELLGSSVHLIKDDETVKEAEEALRRLLSEYDGDAPGETSIAKLDVELVTKEGRRLPCTDRMTLRPLENGSFSGTVGTLRDISRQRRRERILNNLLEAAQEMVGEATTEGVAERVVDVAMNTIEADGAVVREHDPRTDELVPVAVPDPVRDLLGNRPRYDADEGPVGTAFTEGRSVTVDEFDHLDVDPGKTGMYLPIGDSRTLSVGLDSSDQVTDDEQQFLKLLTTTAESVFDRVERDQERRRYEAIVEAADDMLFTLDSDGNFTLVTESFAAMLGLNRSDLVGRPIDEVLVDDDIGRFETETDEGIETETSLLSHDGTEVPCRISVTPITDPVGSGSVGTVRDIRELRLAEQEASRQRRRFTELFDTLTDPLVEVTVEDDATTILTANAQFAELAGLNESEFRDAAVANVREALPSAIVDALDAIKPDTADIEREVRVRTPNGVRFYLLRSVPYQTENRSRAFVVLTDVTEVKQQSTHLRVLHRLLRHNLRNKTNVIHGRAELVRTRTDDPEIDTHAAEIETASRSLVDASETAQSIQEVLQTGAVAPDLLSGEAVEQRLERKASTIDPSERAVRVSVSVDREIPYDDAIERAIGELLENAIEFGTPSPDSTVDLAVSELTDGLVRFSIADDGPGIPEAEWTVVAGDREITQLQHASGMGLWLAKWVADSHGGDLRLLSADEDGTTIALDIPVETSARE
ncbi:PAS domain S-box protein [Halobaculum sp. EA56]|uniref:PAS domain S-box protein n=1 Tax=Halobaculum sp. EA56 TaxID=3421648 RepID=UPI003EC1136A